MTDVWCCITALTSMILSVCWTYGSFTAFCTSGSQASVVPRKELWEPGVASSRQHPRSCRCTGSVATSCASESHAPALRTTSFSHLHWSISISLLDLLGGGHCLCTTGCRASPRHELRLRYLVSFRDIRFLSLYHSVYCLNSLRDLLDGRHPFLYCRFISLNCTCVVSTTFWILLGGSAPGITAGVFTTLLNCRNLNLKHLYSSLLDLDCRNLFA